MLLLLHDDDDGDDDIKMIPTRTRKEEEEEDKRPHPTLMSTMGLDVDHDRGIVLAGGTSSLLFLLG